MFSQLKTAAEALIKDPCNQDVADCTQKYIGSRLTSPVVHQTIGLGVAAVISLTAALLLGRLSSLALCPNVIAFGFLGSAVSMLQRMPRLAVSRHVNMYQAISSGLAQPVIGVGFAISSWVLLSTHLIDFSLPGNNDLALYSAVAFVTGFSERFGPNLVELIERTSD